jgi:hypothetical protein
MALRNGVLLMRSPRLRLSLRSMVAAVALVSLALAYVLPECQRLFWLYRHPRSVASLRPNEHGRDCGDLLQGPMTSGYG